MKIIHKVSTLFSRFPGRQNYVFWFLLALFIKPGIFFYKTAIEKQIVPNEHYTGTFASEGGDSFSYFEPIENLISNGSYDGRQYGDYRMPGYGFVYYILRLIFPVSHALNLLVILQLISSAVSVYVLALIAHLLFNRNAYFYSTYFLYLISTYVSLFDPILLTESFCTSSLILGLYFLLVSDTSKLKNLGAGLLITWCVFLRPVMMPILFISIGYLLIRNSENRISLKRINFKPILFFLIPFLLIEGQWIYRNYQKYDRIIPLTKSKYYPGTEASYWGGLIPFINAFGGSLVYWDPGSAMSFFIPPPDYVKRKVETQLPEYIYTSLFNKDSLIVIRNMVSEANASDSVQQKLIEAEINRKLAIYTASIQNEKPFLYYLGSRFIAFKNIYFQSGTYNLFNKPSFELSKGKLVIKVLYSLLYVVVLIGGFVGLMVLITKGLKNADYLLISSVGLYIALVFPLYLRLCEYRYFVPGYPFFCLATVYILIAAGNKILMKKVNA